MGITYHGRADGYFKAGRQDGGAYLHHAVWIAERGPIPAGNDIHHIDEDRANCLGSNLEALTIAEHRRAHAIARMDARPRREAICERCRGVFVACFTPRFCSNTCRALSRKDAGLDDETRACPCGEAFVVNKHKRQLRCSISCGARARWAAYRNQPQGIAP